MPTPKQNLVTVSRQEFSALMDIRGLPADAHSMVMTACRAPDGKVLLTGERSAFQELLSTAIEEIEEGLATRKNQEFLAELCCRITTANNPYELKRKLS